jgi:S1-C subfamily serine protease
MRYPALIALLVTLLAFGLAWGCTNTQTSTPVPTEAGASGAPDATSARATASPTARGAIDPFAPVVAIVDQAQPSVVTVLTEGGVGSGVVYSSDGTIVTNNHVIAGASSFVVAFASGEQLPAALVGTDPATDVAVLRVERNDLPAANWDVELPEIGSLAVALGSPLGFENTVTVGVVSGVQRTIPGSAQQSQALVDLIQTDAAISPGNSGGALVDAEARVIGMNVAYIPPAASAVSIGFAIPAATVTSVADALIAGRPVQHAFLGIRYGTLTPQVAEQYNLGVEQGLIVMEVVPGGPADAAGIVPGDVITAMAGEPTTQVEDIIAVLRRHAPGETLAIEIVRDGERQTVNAVLGEA